MRNKKFGFTPVERSPSGKMTLKEYEKWIEEITVQPVGSKT